MNLLRCIIFLPFATALVLSQTGGHRRPSGLPNQPEAPVRSLYSEVVARHPKGLLEGTDMKIFAPYLSEGLMRRIVLATACSADWNRQDPDPQLTARIASEYGLFSGEGAEAAPQAFQIEKTDPENDGSSRVYVSLTWEKPNQRAWIWRIAAVVLRENGRFVIDDVVYVDDAVYDREEDRKDKRLSAYLSAGCTGPHWDGHALPNQPEALVSSLYARVVANHPLGIPLGADWKIFAPYLGKALLHRIDLAIKCGADWSLQNPDPNLKPEIGWLELGLFSGGDEQAEPRAFQIEETELGKDGSFIVYVKLMGGTPLEKPSTWRVAAVVLRENGHSVLDDVLFLKDSDREVDSRLSEVLAAGCDGPRWVGYRTWTR
jgi:hypothetical protein